MAKVQDNKKCSGEIMKQCWQLFMKVCRWFANGIFGLFGKKITDDSWSVFEQFFKFAVVGCSNSLVTLLFYYICIWLFGAKFYLLGQTIGYIAGLINSFFWNSRYVFAGVRINKSQAFLKMCLCNVVIYAMQMLLLYCFVDMMSVSEKIAPVIAILITLPFNFILNKMFAFRQQN